MLLIVYEMADMDPLATTVSRVAHATLWLLGDIYGLPGNRLTFLSDGNDDFVTIDAKDI